MTVSSSHDPIQVADRTGCFSRPGEQIDTFLQASASWAQASSTEQYPRAVQKVFADRFGVDLHGVPLEVSSKGLMPWELACCWIDQDGRATIQMRYADAAEAPVPTDAILTHEALHAVRGRLFATTFEEHCAYAACCAAFPHTFPKWRAYVGPLFVSAREIMFLLFFIWSLWGIPMFMDWDVSYEMLFALSFLAFLAPVLRLVSRWKIWNTALHNIASTWPHKEWRLMIRLADDEIVWLSTLRPEDVFDAVRAKAAQDWRWRYFVEKILE
jgi:hypothetical protein